MARTGRRPGGTDTRGEILAAARATFGASGYHGATIRAIAASAGVDPALVHHYFGTKEDLFAASVQMPMRPTAMAEQVLAGGTGELGPRLARVFFTVWEDADSRDALLAMLRGAFTTDTGAAVLREFFGAVLVNRIATQVSGDDAELRMSLVASHLVGVAVLRYVVGFPALAEASVDDLVALLGPRLQDYVDASGRTSAGSAPAMASGSAPAMASGSAPAMALGSAPAMASGADQTMASGPGTRE